MGISNTASTALISRAIAESAWVRLYNSFPLSLVTRATGGTGFVMPTFTTTTSSGTAITTESGVVSTLLATAFVVGQTLTIASIGTTTSAQWIAAGAAGVADVAAGAFVVGRTYRILTVGATNFVSVGAANSTIGTVFVCTGTGASNGTGTVSNVLVGQKFICTAVGVGTGTAVADGYVSPDIAMTASVGQTTTDLNTYRAQVTISNELLQDSTIQEVLAKRLSGQMIEQVGNAIVASIANTLYTAYRFSNEPSYDIGLQNTMMTDYASSIQAEKHSGFKLFSRLQNQYRNRACWIFSPSGFRSYGTQEGRLNLVAAPPFEAQAKDSTVDQASQGGEITPPNLSANQLLLQGLSNKQDLEKRSSLNYTLNNVRPPNNITLFGCPTFTSDGLGIVFNPDISGTSLTNSTVNKTIGTQYLLTDLGTTTTAQWNSLGASGIPFVGQVFSALATSTAGTGTVVAVTSKTVWMMLVDLSSYLLFDQPLEITLDTESRIMFNQTVVHCIYRANGLLVEPQAGWIMADVN